MTNSADPDDISWLLKKPTDLDLHCLRRQGMLCSAKERLKVRTNADRCTQIQKVFIKAQTKLWIGKLNP